MQLKHPGYPDVRLYNGGWGYWGNALSLPVVEGENPLTKISPSSMHPQDQAWHVLLRIF